MPDPSQSPSIGRESVGRTLFVALSVSLVCSSLVASAAVVLKPRQVANALLERRRNILEVAGLMKPGRDVDELFMNVEPRVIELETGTYLDDVDPRDFDPEQAARDSERSVLIPPELDVVRLGRRAKRARVYLVRDEGEVSRIILPISGYGLWSTIHGFLALEPDATTVADIVFYSHGETAGIGDFITDRDWLDLWIGKRAFDDEGHVAIEVYKGRTTPDDPLADYRVDAVSGATLTGNGVTHMMQYWLGDHGYGPYLKRIRKGGEM